MADASLLRGLRCRTLGFPALLHTAGDRRDDPHPVIQDIEIRRQIFSLMPAFPRSPARKTQRRENSTHLNKPGTPLRNPKVYNPKNENMLYSTYGIM